MTLNTALTTVAIVLGLSSAVLLLTLICWLMQDSEE